MPAKIPQATAHGKGGRLNPDDIDPHWAFG